MWFIIKLLYSAIFMGLWYLMIRYRRNVKSWTGNFVWAERYLWNGWTNLIIVLFALGLIFFWAMYPFWVFEVLPKNPTP
jgi:hypothetical protein